MFKRVDAVTEEVEGFSYLNKNDIEERVFVNNDYALVEIQCDDGRELSKIYFQDIPKLIKALQAACDKIMSET